MYAKTPLGALGLVLLGVSFLGAAWFVETRFFGLLFVAPVIAVIGLIPLCSGIICLVPAASRRH
jgi:hypothetical protein